MAILVPLLVALATLAVAAILATLLAGIRYIPNDRIAIVEKRFSRKGSLRSGLIALGGEAGFQPDVLRGGLHFRSRFKYRLHKGELVTIPQGGIGYVFARDGQNLVAGQALASNARVADFQDAAAFLRGGGEKGPQRRILREGTYALNLALFIILSPEKVFYLPLEKGDDDMVQKMRQRIEERGGFAPVVIRDAEDKIGVVVTHDGPSLAPGEIIAPIVGNAPADEATYHNNFQDPDHFLAAGGRRGRQLQVLVEGTYYINRLFATVEYVNKTVIEVGSVGVVVSYTGEGGRDLSGEDYRHGELVKAGERGVWQTPLLPGKYAWNVYAGKVLLVPTTNFILKWTRGETGAHKFDENLVEVSLITKDAFEPSLPLSVVVHIDYRMAPLVIQRFGDIKRLVEQTLDPMVSAYFKNIGQTRTLIQLLQDRAAIQDAASVDMRSRFEQYNLTLEEVLIGTPSTAAARDNGATGSKIEQILTQLRDRQIADEQVETYERKQRAAVHERELREAEAHAAQQSDLTRSEISIVMQENAGKAAAAQARQEADRIRTLAHASAEQTRLVGEGEAARIRAMAGAEAERAARVGVAQALAVEEQVRAYGGPHFQLVQEVMSRFAAAIETSRVDVVPKILFGAGNGHQGGASFVESLLSLLMSERVSEMAGVRVPIAPTANPQVQAIKEELRSKILPPDAPKT